MSDAVDLLDRTTGAVADVVAAVNPDQLDARTPCTEWTVRDLLNHMVGTAELFTYSARGERSPFDPFGQPDEVIGDDPGRSYDEARERLIKAWRARGLDGTVPLLSGDTPAPGACMIAMCDHLAHGWDLARAIGVPFDPDDDVLAAAEEFTRANMSPERRGPGMPFAHPVDPPPGASRFDQWAAFMGRQPE
jgi:uncharacterized protein (TIGR03086 family)